MFDGIKVDAQTWKKLELKVELLGEDLEILRAQLGETDSESEEDDSAADLDRLLNNKDASVLNGVLRERLRA